jgi:tetratricopeptide (TPR) repeat protein
LRTESRSVRAAALLLAALLAGATPARAQQDATDDAAKNMERGSDAMARGDFKQAAVFFRAAKELKPTASGPLLALGLALRANGECKEAVVHLEEYLRRKPQGADPKAKDALDYCKKQLEPPPLGTSSAPLARREATEPVIVKPTEPPPPPRPFYKTWWFWTATGAVVAGGIAAAVVLSLPGKSAPAGTGGTGPAQPAFNK